MWYETGVGGSILGMGALFLRAMQYGSAQRRDAFVTAAP